MHNDLHHVTVFVRDMDRALHLFRDILGFELLWRKVPVGGRKLSALVDIPDIELELAFLQGRPGGVAVELARMIRPTLGEPQAKIEGPGTSGLCLMVKDLDGVHQRLTEEGWSPFTACMEMMTPEGDPIRAFCFRTDEGMNVELIEEVAVPDQKTGGA
jgi:catechol 2,3-dioxygenase-like lactoylglutathione lyase family enzyme